MADKAGGHRGGLGPALADFIELLGKAILSGIAASVVLALLTLGLAATASAQTNPDDVVSDMRGNLPWSAALTPSPSREAAGVGALWARARIASPMDELRLRGGETRTALVKASAPHAPAAGELAQTDTESTLHIVLGLLALAVAGLVVVVALLIRSGGAASGMRNAEGER